MGCSCCYYITLFWFRQAIWTAFTFSSRQFPPAKKADAPCTFSRRRFGLLTSAFPAKHGIFRELCSTFFTKRHNLHLWIYFALQRYYSILSYNTQQKSWDFSIFLSSETFRTTRLMYSCTLIYDKKRQIFHRNFLFFKNSAKRTNWIVWFWTKAQNKG